MDTSDFETEVSTRARGRKTYQPEYRQRLIELYRAGRSAESLARDFEPTAQTIRNWVAQADRDGGQRTDGLTTAECEELRQLRRENRRLSGELEIPGKAVAWFAQKTDGSTSRRRTRS